LLGGSDADPIAEFVGVAGEQRRQHLGEHAITLPAVHRLFAC
jgi:hypothetical protein